MLTLQEGGQGDCPVHPILERNLKSQDKVVSAAMHARVRDVAYFVRTRASSSEPLELSLVGKGGRAAGPLAAEERKTGVRPCRGILDYRCAWVGTHRGRRGPFSLGEGEMERDVVVLERDGEC